VPALFAGIVAGAVVAHLDEITAGMVISAFEAIGSYLAEAVLPGIGELRLDLRGDGDLLFGWLSGDPTAISLDHLIITAFSLAIAAMVGVLSRSGATRAVVRLIEGLARGPRGAQVAAWLAGFVVFFDDYANCLVVGSAMGPVCDRFSVSRAKLAFIVDCTAAPIASIALVSTWVGYEIGLIASELTKLGSDISAFGLFIQALPYAFYAFSALAMVGAVAILGRDFGPMLAAERAARAATIPPDDEPPSRALDAIAAIVTVSALLGVTLGALWLDGRASVADASTATWFDVLAAADPFRALLLGSTSALVLACVFAVLSGGLIVRRIPAALWAGLKPVLPAIAVLFLAWGLGNAMQDTKAAEHLTELARPSTAFTYIGEPIAIPYTIAGPAARLRLEILDAGDRVIFASSPRPDADPVLRWDGSSSAGAAASPGRYRVRASAFDAEGSSVDVIVQASQRFPPWLLPAVVFVVAAATAFATGTSFGTLAILIPLVIPLGLALQGGEPGPVLLGGVAAVLSGAILGDHASPISDTTVLAALGAGVDLMTHVQTQIPYAMTAGVVALAFGFIPAGLGVSPWISAALCIGAVVLIVAVVGRRPERDAPLKRPLIEMPEDMT